MNAAALQLVPPGVTTHTSTVPAAWAGVDTSTSPDVSLMMRRHGAAELDFGRLFEPFALDRDRSCCLR